jgi:hypothetical protein
LIKKKRFPVDSDIPDLYDTDDENGKTKQEDNKKKFDKEEESNKKSDQPTLERRRPNAVLT